MRLAVGDKGPVAIIDGVAMGVIGEEGGKLGRHNTDMVPRSTELCG